MVGDQFVFQSELFFDSGSETLLLGASPSQEVKCFALGQEERSSPHSATSFKER